jgi:hypothetical protein
MLCDVSVVLNSLGDVLGLMSCKCSSENGQVLVGFQSTEAFGRLHHAGGGPTQRHRGISPSLLSEMSLQIIPLKGRKICGNSAEFWRQRLFAFELRHAPARHLRGLLFKFDWGVLQRSAVTAALVTPLQTSASRQRLIITGCKIVPLTATRQVQGRETKHRCTRCP